MTLQKCPGCGKETFIPPNSISAKSWCTCGHGAVWKEYIPDNEELRTRIAELEAENLKLSTCYQSVLKAKIDEQNYLHRQVNEWYDEAQYRKKQAERITDAYKLLIDKLNEEDEINISP